MLNGDQQRVYEWLNDDLRLPVFAAAYNGAIELLNQKSEGYVSFVAHAGRDLMNVLASTVANVKPGRVQYQQHIDDLEGRWSEEWRLADGLATEANDKGHFIPADVCQRISNLIDEHKSGRMRSAEADGLFFSTFLDYSDIDRIPRNLLLEWRAAKRWFVGHVHLRKEPFQAGIDNDLVRHFKCLDGYLFIAASSQYDRLRDLNEILGATNQ